MQQGRDERILYAKERRNKLYVALVDVYFFLANDSVAFATRKTRDHSRNEPDD